jgi:hypothetical protein
LRRGVRVAFQSAISNQQSAISNVLPGLPSP